MPKQTDFALVNSILILVAGKLDQLPPTPKYIHTKTCTHDKNYSYKSINTSNFSIPGIIRFKHLFR